MQLNYCNCECDELSTSQHYGVPLLNTMMQPCFFIQSSFNTKILFRWSRAIQSMFSSKTTTPVRPLASIHYTSSAHQVDWYAHCSVTGAGNERHNRRMAGFMLSLCPQLQLLQHDVICIDCEDRT